MGEEKQWAKAGESRPALSAEVHALSNPSPTTILRCLEPFYHHPKGSQRDYPEWKSKKRNGRRPVRVPASWGDWCYSLSKLGIYSLSRCTSNPHKVRSTSPILFRGKLERTRWPLSVISIPTMGQRHRRMRQIREQGRSMLSLLSFSLSLSVPDYTMLLESVSGEGRGGRTSIRPCRLTGRRAYRPSRLYRPH